MFKIRWINKKTGYIGIGDILTQEFDIKDGKPYKLPLDLEEAEDLCKYVNKNYIKARHFVVET